MRRLAKPLVVTVCLVGPYLLAPVVWAGSYYSSSGIGLVHHFVSARSQGMGGVGLATPELLTVNFMNPASLPGLPLTMLSANFFHSSTEVTTARQSGRVTDTNPFGFQFVVPLAQDVAGIAIGLNSYSTMEFSYEETRGSVVESVSGKGGVQTAFFSLGIRPIKKLYLGVSVLYFFGTVGNRWTLDFPTGSRQRDTRSENTFSLSGAGLRFGAIFQITSAWHVGAVWTPSVDVSGKRFVGFENVNEFSDFPEEEASVPASFGLGTSLEIGKKFLVAVDYFTRRWEKVNVLNYTKPSQRIGVGFEFSAKGGPFSSFLSRTAFRAGAFYRDLGLERPEGKSVKEVAGTVGLGLPIRWHAARLDFGLQFGKRGSSDNVFQENFISLYGGITLGSKWFQRRKR